MFECRSKKCFEWCYFWKASQWCCGVLVSIYDDLAECYSMNLCSMVLACGHMDGKLTGSLRNKLTFSHKTESDTWKYYIPDMWGYSRTAYSCIVWLLLFANNKQGRCHQIHFHCDLLPTGWPVKAKGNTVGCHSSKCDTYSFESHVPDCASHLAKLSLKTSQTARLAPKTYLQGSWRFLASSLCV